MKMKILVLPLLLLLSGCDLLTTRDAQSPGNPRSNYELPVTPQILIQNLVNSFQDRNVENYLSCFSNPAFSEKKFQFIPSSGAAAQFPSLTDSWDLKSEDQYFRNMISKMEGDLPATLVFSNPAYSPQGDSLVLDALYSLNVPHNQQDLPTNFQGEVRFYMVRDSRSTWAIYYWQDNKNSTLASWSELKGRFY